jgi:hypothetical protein
MASFPAAKLCRNVRQSGQPGSVQVRESDAGSSVKTVVYPPEIHAGTKFAQKYLNLT